ncbi:MULTISPECIES: hypothetical protein [unclassified Rickettsia]|uniref:hypothetical protein n=1 Tax=unclassified Rickettsia TaxID=114295 RepID=UPI0031335396
MWRGFHCSSWRGGIVAWIPKPSLRAAAKRRGNLENNSHPEFISGSLALDAETSSA